MLRFALAALVAAWTESAAGHGQCSASQSVDASCLPVNGAEAGGDEAAFLQQFAGVIGARKDALILGARQSEQIAGHEVRSSTPPGSSDGQATRQRLVWQGRQVVARPRAEDASKVKTRPFGVRALDFALGGHQDVETADTVASVQQILLVYFILFMPLIAAWMGASYAGTATKHYGIFTLCMFSTFTVTYDLANQALCAWMGSPMGLAAIQAFGTFLGMGMWAACQRKEGPLLCWLSCMSVLRWLPAAMAFVAYQLANHWVSYTCSLSERVVFMNLTPAVTLVIELAIMQPHLRSKVSVKICVALVAMVVGAVLFGAQYAGFSGVGMLSASLLLFTAIPYRILQRWLLLETNDLSVPLLCSFDGLLLIVPSWLVAQSSLEGSVMQNLSDWLSVPHLALVLVLSTISLAGGHASSLLILRGAPATHFQVIYNMANFFIVLLGALLFADPIFEYPLVGIGIAVSLSGGAAYSLLAAPPSPGEEDDGKTTCARLSDRIIEDRIKAAEDS